MKMCWHSRRPLSTRNMKCERKCDVSCELIEQVLWIWQSYQMMMMTELSFWKTRDIEYTKNTRDSVITCHLLLTYLSNTTNSRKCIDISWKCNHLKVSCCSLLPGRVVDIVLLLFLSRTLPPPTLLLLPVFSIHSFLSFLFFFSFLFSISQFYFYNPPGSPAVSTTRFSDLQNIILRILIITARLYNYCIVIQTRSKKKSVPVFECATITHPRLWKPSNLKWNRVRIQTYIYMEITKN